MVTPARSGPLAGSFFFDPRVVRDPNQRKPFLVALGVFTAIGSFGLSHAGYWAGKFVVALFCRLRHKNSPQNFPTVAVANVKATDEEQHGTVQPPLQNIVDTANTSKPGTSKGSQTFVRLPHPSDIASRAIFTTELENQHAEFLNSIKELQAELSEALTKATAPDDFTKKLIKLCLLVEQRDETFPSQTETVTLKSNNELLLRRSSKFCSSTQLAGIKETVSQRKRKWLAEYASKQIEQSIQTLKESIPQNPSSPPPPEFTTEYQHLSKLVEDFDAEYHQGPDLDNKFLSLKDSATQAHWLLAPAD